MIPNIDDLSLEWNEIEMSVVKLSSAKDNEGTSKCVTFFDETSYVEIKMIEIIKNINYYW